MTEAQEERAVADMVAEGSPVKPAIEQSSRAVALGGEKTAEELAARDRAFQSKIESALRC